MTVLQSGSWVSKTVRLDHCIARGGMAEIWQGEHVTLGIKVAVKCLLPPLARRASALRRFLGEAQIAARLGDPHVVRVLDCVVDYRPDGQQAAFIVMELLEGGDLGQRVDRSGPLSLDETCAIIHQVSCALSAAHEVGIVHRDVKPENIFLVDDADRLQVKLLDFGVAKELGRAPALTMVGITLGTPQYMSPEQLQGAPPVDGRYDVWSLAVVAYVCLTRRLPFEGRTVDAVNAAIREGGPRPPSGYRHDLPPSVDAVFARAFHPNLASRFQGARDLADALLGARRDCRPGTEAARPSMPVSTSRVRIIDDTDGPGWAIPFDLVRPLSPHVVGSGKK
jgi:eukaryotic-like serine/threonine-protein kinase